MTVYNFNSGLGNSAAYEVSGVPWARGAINASTATGVEFPSVTRWVMISNNPGGGNLKIGFSENGVDSGNAFIELKTGEVSPVLELKLTELWLSGSANVGVMAGLTSIETNKIDNLTISPSGSNWSGSLAARVG